MFNFALIVVACIPLYIIRFPIFGFPTTVLEILLLIWFAWWLMQNYRGLITRVKQNIFAKKLHNRYPFDWELILLLIISLGAVITAGSSLAAFGVWRAYFFEPALAFILFINTFNSKEKILKAISALAISSIVISLIAAYQYITGDFIPNAFWAQADGRRATSLYPYPNAIGLYLAPLACVFAGACVSIFKENKRRAALYAVAFLASMSAILFAQSDGALFGVSAALFIALLIANNKTRLIALGLAVIGATILFVSPPLKTYVLERAFLNDFSGQVRRLQWRETLNMISDGRKVTGAGLTKYQETVAPYHQEGFFFNKEKMSEAEFNSRVNNNEAFRKSHWQPLETYLYPHNIFLNFWTEIGLLGMLLFAWIAVRYARLSFASFEKFKITSDSLSWLSLGLLSALVAVIIHGLVDVPYFKNDLAIEFWLLASFVGTLLLIKKTA